VIQPDGYWVDENEISNGPGTSRARGSGVWFVGECFPSTRAMQGGGWDCVVCKAGNAAAATTSRPLPAARVPPVQNPGFQRPRGPCPTTPKVTELGEPHLPAVPRPAQRRAGNQSPAARPPVVGAGGPGCRVWASTAWNFVAAAHHHRRAGESRDVHSARPLRIAAPRISPTNQQALDARPLTPPDTASPRLPFDAEITPQFCTTQCRPKRDLLRTSPAAASSSSRGRMSAPVAP